MFEDTKGVTWRQKSKDREYNGQQKKGQKDKHCSTKNYTEISIEHHEPHQDQRMNSCASEVHTVPVPLLTPVVLLLNDTNII